MTFSVRVRPLLFPITMNRMKQMLPFVLMVSSVAVGCRADQPPSRATERSVAAAACEFVAVPSATNTFQFRLYTNASPDAQHLFNTFDVEAYGEELVRSPATSPFDASLHNTLVNGNGPELVASNGL